MQGWQDVGKVNILLLLYLRILPSSHPDSLHPNHYFDTISKI